ncbi:HD-GYP domain-containing protein [Fusibacter sp. JL216-2]|uniref:HD-GYP domain-containing protein n=1 Tax=Fusibacter sp. JL216-2 TaxID=3071453 RepID=UPI003D341607
MKTISVDLLEKGMVINQDIYDSNGVLIISDGAVLKDAHVEYLKYESGILDVKIKEYSNIVAEQKPSAYNEAQVKFETQYKGSVDKFKSMFKSATLGGKVLYADVEHVVGPLLSEVETGGDIAQKIWQIRQSDEYTFEHSVQVSLYSALIGSWLGMEPDELKDLAIAGLLHDIGKCNIPDEILNKPDALTEAEFKVMRTHPTLGYVLLANTKQFNDAVLSGVLQHHERSDGSGYPNSLKGPHIHPYARIVAIADIYSAMTSDRVYRERECPFMVAGQIQEKSFGSLDPFYSKVFVSNIVQYFVGNQVELNNGSRGEIIFIEKNHPIRPLVKTESGFINLVKDNSLYVTDVLHQL